MFTPGPRTTCTPRARASRAIAVPMRSATAGSQLDPTATAGGKQVAGRFSKIPRASKSPAWRRTPCGPAVSTTAGSPPTGLVDQKSRPDSSAAFSSRVRPSRSSGETWITPEACLTRSNRHPAGRSVPEGPEVLHHRRDLGAPGQRGGLAGGGVQRVGPERAQGHLVGEDDVHLRLLAQARDLVVQGGAERAAGRAREGCDDQHPVAAGRQV